MISISVKSNIDIAAAKLRTLPKQINFAAKNAVNETAKIAQTKVVAEMQDVFDAPTPWTLKGTKIEYANIATLAAVVRLKGEREVSTGTPVAKYLQSEIAGGERRLKGFERALRSAGVLPDGMFIVPGKGIQLDEWGNIPRGEIVKVLSYFRAFPEEGRGWKMNATAKTLARKARGTRKHHGYALFVGRPGDGKLPLGIWERMQSQMVRGSGIKPLFIFVQGVRYEARFDFRYVVELAVREHFNDQFNVALQQAIATARTN